jgi:hypothetical protein
LEDIHVNLMLSTLEWLKRFKGEAVDYLLERHSPKSLKTLQQLKDSEFLKAIHEVDGTSCSTDTVAIMEMPCSRQGRR